EVTSGHPLAVGRKSHRAIPMPVLYKSLSKPNDLDIGLTQRYRRVRILEVIFLGDLVSIKLEQYPVVCSAPEGNSASSGGVASRNQIQDQSRPPTPPNNQEPALVEQNMPFSISKKLEKVRSVVGPYPYKPFCLFLADVSTTRGKRNDAPDKEKHQSSDSSGPNENHGAP